jgi:riboflavin synthase
VQGHVDGTGVVTVRVAHPAYDEIRIAVGHELARYLAGKGAIAVDGISLTVIDVVDNDDGAEFGIGVIPETRSATTMGATKVGTRVNLEVDVVAKYVERLLAARDRESA